MVVNTKFNIGQIVYLKTDKEQLSRIVVRIQIAQMGILYCLNQGIIESWHYDFEMTEEVDTVLKVC